MRTAVLTALAILGILLSVLDIEGSEHVYYFHNDHLGTPQAMSDTAGRKVWEAEYDPFGKATVNQDPDSDGQIVVNNLRFPGQYYDAETGLHYNYHRDYDPATGRYLQPDPIGLEKGENHLYAYARGNPINAKDPLGLDPRDALPPRLDPGTDTCSPNTPNCSRYGTDSVVGAGLSEICQSTGDNCWANCTRACLLVGYGKADDFLTTWSWATDYHSLCFMACSVQCAARGE